MEKVIIIRYGEIFLKGKNREYFESLLIKNIKSALNGIAHKFSRSQSRYYVEDFDALDCEDIIDRLKKVFGIYSMSVAKKVTTDYYNGMPQIRAAIKEMAKEIWDENTKENPTFRVSVKRADKSLPQNSSQIAADLGGNVLEAARFEVSLDNFDYQFMVDIRENGYSFVYSKVISGAGGLPVGCSGRGMVLLSGGIDSPVSAYMMAKRGMKLCAVHFSSPPYTSDRARDKVVELKNILLPYTTEIKLYVVPFTDIQLAIHKHCPSEFMITIMRRYMMRIATILAKKEGCGALITGESLGQVASQTTESMTCTGATAGLPVFRPLIAFDKEDIMSIAKRIGTFETSILPYEDCCTIFLPKSPAIKPRLNVVEEAEKSLAEIDLDLVQKAVDNVEIF